MKLNLALRGIKPQIPPLQDPIIILFPKRKQIVLIIIYWFLIIKNKFICKFKFSIWFVYQSGIGLKLFSKKH